MPIERIECATHDEHDTLVRLIVSVDDIKDLAAGYVPAVVKANCLGVLALEDEDRRRAERPIRQDEARAKRPEPKVRRSKSA